MSELPKPQPVRNITLRSIIYDPSNKDDPIFVTFGWLAPQGKFLCQSYSLVGLTVKLRFSYIYTLHLLRDQCYPPITFLLYTVCV